MRNHSRRTSSSASSPRSFEPRRLQRSGSPRRNSACKARRWRRVMLENGPNPGRDADDEPEANATPAVEPRTPNTPMSEGDQVSRRAYERFQARGGEHGRDQEDWF